MGTLRVRTYAPTLALTVSLWALPSWGAHLSKFSCPDTLEGLRQFQVRLHAEIQSGSEARPTLEWLERCEKDQPSLFTPPNLQCFANVRRFLKNRVSFEGHNLRWSIPDDDYLSGKGLDFPEMMKPPAQLAEGKLSALLSDPKRYESALKKIDQMNRGLPEDMRWKIARYRSQHLQQDGAWGRVILYIPGKNFDQFYQLGADHEGKALIGNATLVAVQKTDRHGKPLERPRMRIADFGRTYLSRPWWTLGFGPRRVKTAALSEGKGGNCYDCHKSGFYTIDPAEPEKMLAADRDALKFINRVGLGYGPTDIDGVDLGAYGPAFGPKVERPDSFLDSCAKLPLGEQTPDERSRSYDRIRQAMNCSECHAPPMRNSFNYSSFRADSKIIQKYIIESRKMPPAHPRLTGAERTATFNCLRREYYGDVDLTGKMANGLFGDWVLQPECKLTAGATNCADPKDASSGCLTRATSARSDAGKTSEVPSQATDPGSSSTKAAQ